MKPTVRLARASAVVDHPVVCVRAVTATHGEELRAMFARLSPRSIYHRFHAPYPAVPRWAGEAFLNTGIPSGESLVAVAGTRIVGHAMYAASPGSREAEVGILVEDSWQSREIGRFLLAALARGARRQGIAIFSGEVLGEYRRAVGLFENVLPGTRYSISGGRYHVRAPLDDAGSTEAGRGERRVA
jgi:GNAT superfamily N-acetyltransferase